MKKGRTKSPSKRGKKKSKAISQEELQEIILQAKQSGLTELRLGGRGLREVPPEIGQLTLLTDLDLHNPFDTPKELRNRISSLPVEIGKLTKLTRLNLAGNNLTVLGDPITSIRMLRTLDLSSNQLRSLPESISKLASLEDLNLSNNALVSLPRSIGEFSNLQWLDVGSNSLLKLPASIGKLDRLQKLDVSNNALTVLPTALGKLSSLLDLDLSNNRFTVLPEFIGQLSLLQTLELAGNKLGTLPDTLSQLTSLRRINLFSNHFQELPKWLGNLDELTQFALGNNPITNLPEFLGSLSKLQFLDLGDFAGGLALRELPPFIRRMKNLNHLVAASCELTHLPEWIGELAKLERLVLDSNNLTDIPSSLGRLTNLSELGLQGNPLNPTLQSVYNQGLDALGSYLRSLEQAEPLYEAKLVLVGEGGVGKTTLLKALSGGQPRANEPTTHGVSIDVHSMSLPYPGRDDIRIQFNAWDFGGQEVYRVTHQFFFSPRSVYLLVWEPRMGVQQSQVEDWLKLIRLRVGDAARVIIVSTHSKTGERIARIDKPIFSRDYGSIIVDFIEVDSLEDDPKTGDKYGIPELRSLIAEASKDLEQMGMPFNIYWRAARDELIKLGNTEPHVGYEQFAEVCARHGLSTIDTRTLAGLMHDLGYIVYYGDDERLKDDVVLQPEWLTKAIGFVLENRDTQDREGVLPDGCLEDVWLNHSFENEPRYNPIFFPFFLRLMEKYDVSYRLEGGKASLVAQLVPQIRPSLPWLPEEEPNTDLRRLAMVYVMDEAPPGLVPWMIVRTHEYEFERRGHRLHWQKGMFLRNKRHGEAMLELRGREFHLYTEAIWPEYFMNILRQTLTKLISDNWPGMLGRYTFTVPCRQRTNGEMCQGRFDINALRDFLEDGDQTIRCQVCRRKQEIVELLFGFEDEEPREQLARIEGKLDVGLDRVQKDIGGLESRLANSVMAIMRAMANEAKDGPRLFDVEPVNGNWRRLFETRYRLRLWCEADNCQHPVLEPNHGTYEFKSSREWVQKIAPYANFVAGMLRTLLPMVAPSVDLLFGSKTIEGLGISDHLDLMKEATSTLEGELRISHPEPLQQGILNENERSGLLALHALLKELDPQQAKLGLTRIPTYTGDFLWLCPTHYQLSQPRIAEVAR
jgi:internalin A